MNGRVYDPFLGRMISADPTVPGAFNSQAFNRYSYVLNSPLGFTDPSGFSPDHIGLRGSSGELRADGGGGMSLDYISGEGWMCVDRGCLNGEGQPAQGGAGARGFSGIEFLSTSMVQLGRAREAASQQLLAQVQARIEAEMEHLTGVPSPGTPALPGSTTVTVSSGGTVQGIWNRGVRAASRSHYGVVYLYLRPVAGLGPAHLSLRYRDRHGQWHWISAGPSDGWGGPGSELVGGLDEDALAADSPYREGNELVGFVTLANSSGEELWAALATGADFYCDCLGYDYFGAPITGYEYNSNGWVFGLINWAGGIPSISPSDFVGGSSPVPPGWFGPRP